METVTNFECEEALYTTYFKLINFWIKMIIKCFQNLTLTKRILFFNFSFTLNGLLKNLNCKIVSEVSQPRSIFSTPLISPNVSIDSVLSPTWLIPGIILGFKCVSHRLTWSPCVNSSTEQTKYL